MPLLNHDEKRISVIDILRGFAVFGILVLNMKGFSQPSLYLTYTGQELWNDRLSIVIQALITIFGEGKFYSLFSFLFGLSTYLFLNRLEQSGKPFRLIYSRRLLALLSIGLMHAFLLWWGDILVMYAIGGFLLMAFYHSKSRIIITWILITTASLIAFIVLIVGFISFMELSMPGVLESEQMKVAAKYEARMLEAVRVYQEGSYSDIFLQRLDELSLMYSNGLAGLFPVFAMFLAGLLAGKKGWFHAIYKHQSVFRKAQLWGLVIGLPLSVLFWLSKVMLNPQEPGLYDVVNVVCMMIGTPALSFFYMAMIVRWYSRKSEAVLWLALARVGRMALTHYLLQTMVCTSLFYGYGLGLYGKVPPVTLLLMAIGLFLIQVIISMWWLKRFRYGIAEWMWRCVTYAKLQPIRK